MDQAGIAHCRLEGGTEAENKYFLDAMQEVLSPIDNPRYLLVRESKSGGMRRVDYHAAPDVIGRKKANAEYFAKAWKKRVGKARLVYTRNEEGRRILLKARVQALSSAFRKKADQISVWE